MQHVERATRLGTTTASLQNEGKNVTHHENLCEPIHTNHRLVLGLQLDNDSGQRHVNCSGKQGRRNQQQNRLANVRTQSLWVVVGGGSSNVTDDFKKPTHYEWDHRTNASSGASIGWGLHKCFDELDKRHQCGDYKKNNGDNGKDFRRRVPVRLPNVSVWVCGVIGHW